MASVDKRLRLVDAAVSLAYRNGFGATSLADIAGEAEVPLGNVYYYFKTKDEIAEAIVDLRRQQLVAMLKRWDEVETPKERLHLCIESVSNNKDALARRGCAVGTLCSELHKADGPAATRSAGIFGQYLDWLEAQFKALDKGKASRGLAVHLLSAMQGVSVLAHVLHDPRLVTMETKRLKDWVEIL